MLTNSTMLSLLERLANQGGQTDGRSALESLLASRRAEAEAAQISAGAAISNASDVRSEAAKKQLAALEETRPKSWKEMSGKEKGTFILEAISRGLATFASSNPGQTASNFIQDMAELRRTYTDRRAALQSQIADSELGAAAEQAQRAREFADEKVKGLEQLETTTAGKIDDRAAAEEAEQRRFSHSAQLEMFRQKGAFERLEASNAASLRRIYASDALTRDRTVLNGHIDVAKRFAAGAQEAGLDASVAYGLALRQSTGDTLSEEENSILQAYTGAIGQDQSNKRAAQLVDTLTNRVLTRNADIVNPAQYATPDKVVDLYTSAGGTVPPSLQDAVSSPAGSAESNLFDENEVAYIDELLSRNKSVPDETLAAHISEKAGLSPQEREALFPKIVTLIKSRRTAKK